MRPNHIAIEVSQDEHYRSAFLKDLKENWPSMAKDYRHYCHACHPQQGDIWIWTSPEGQKLIHFIIDDASGSLLSPERRMHFFRLGLKHLSKVAEVEGIAQIEFPKGSFKFNDSELSAAESLFAETINKAHQKNSSLGGA